MLFSSAKKAHFQTAKNFFQEKSAVIAGPAHAYGTADEIKAFRRLSPPEAPHPIMELRAALPEGGEDALKAAHTA